MYLVGGGTKGDWGAAYMLKEALDCSIAYRQRKMHNCAKLLRNVSLQSVSSKRSLQVVYTVNCA